MQLHQHGAAETSCLRTNLSFLHGGVHKGVMYLQGPELAEVIDKFILVLCSLHTVCCNNRGAKEHIGAYGVWRTWPLEG